MAEETQEEDIKFFINFNEIDSERLLEFVSLARFYAASPVGLLKVYTEPSLPSFTLQHLPFSLLPTPFMKDKFQFSLELQPHINLLWHRCARDKDFLHASLDSVAKSDIFIRKLLELLDDTDRFKAKRIRLNIIRSDYMLHGDLESSDHAEYNLKQVEVNTIAAGMFNACSRVQVLHQFTMQYYQQLMNAFGKKQEFQAPLQPYFDFSKVKMPPNSADEHSVLTMATAFEKYCSLYQTLKTRTIVLFIVVPDGKEYFVFDQRPTEIGLFNKHGIRVRRRTLTQLNRTIKLGQNSELLLEGEEEVAVVYFRSAYNSTFYPTADEWNTRLILEESRAVLCPDIATHLMTFKSIQLNLSKPGMVEKYIKDREVAQKISSVFAEQVALDGSDLAKAAISRAKIDKTAYVLKPNKEGGSNNLFDDDIIKFFNEVTDENILASYVLMQKLYPPTFPVCLVNPNKKHEVVQGSNELGVYGHLIEVDGCVEVNIEAGHALKVKSAKVDECGLSIGNGFIDSPLLF